jgi:hypothetical protein
VGQTGSFFILTCRILQYVLYISSEEFCVVSLAMVIVALNWI